MRGVAKVFVGCIVLGCVGIVAAGAVFAAVIAFDDSETLASSERVALDRAQHVDANIQMGAGTLRISAALPAMDSPEAGTLLDADFRFDEDHAPLVDYVVASDTGELRIDTEEPDGFLGWLNFATNHDIEWDIALTGEVPIALDANLGAGESDIDLRGLDIVSLTFDTGAGDASVDLSGDRPDGFLGEIDMGAGDLNVILPDDIGVRVTVDQGAGDVSTSTGFSRQGDDYVNDAWATADIQIEITIDQGAGDISLELA